MLIFILTISAIATVLTASFFGDRISSRLVTVWNYDREEAVRIAMMFVCISVAVVVAGIVVPPLAIILSFFYALPISGAIDLHHAVRSTSATISA